MQKQSDSHAKHSDTHTHLSWTWPSYACAVSWRHTTVLFPRSASKSFWGLETNGKMTCDKRIRLKNPRDHRKDKKLYKNHAVLSMLISLGKAEKRFFTTFFMGKCNDPSKKYRRFLPLFGQFSLLPLTALPPIVLPSSLVFRTRPSPPPSNSTPVKKLSQKSSGFIEKILPWRFEVSPTLWWSIIPRVEEEEGGANWKITGSRPTDRPTVPIKCHMPQNEGLFKIGLFLRETPARVRKFKKHSTWHWL